MQVNAVWLPGVLRQVALGVLSGYVPSSDSVLSSVVWIVVSMMWEASMENKAHVLGPWSGFTMAKWSSSVPDVWAGLVRVGREEMVEHAHVHVERGKSVFWVRLGVDWDFSRRAAGQAGPSLVRDGAWSSDGLGYGGGIISSKVLSPPTCGIMCHHCLHVLSLCRGGLSPGSPTARTSLACWCYAPVQERLPPETPLFGAVPAVPAPPRGWRRRRVWAAAALPAPQVVAGRLPVNIYQLYTHTGSC